MADTAVGKLPRAFGVYEWFRDGEPVCAGKAAGRGGLRHRLCSHLGTGTGLTRLSLRRDVA